MDPHLKSNEHRKSYDEIPYLSYSHEHSHPNRMAAVAALFGLTSPNVRTASILELGCASGGNLIPIALSLPESKCLGIDFSGVQINAARKDTEVLGINNVTFEQDDFRSFTRSEKTFDYIIAHGVFSWIPRDLQSVLLELIARHLSPDGVAFVSYNTLPGWHLKAGARDLMLFHAENYGERNEYIKACRDILKLFSKFGENTQDSNLHTFQSEHKKICATSDSHLYHDNLEIYNNPLYFTDFINLADESGLSYLGEAAPGTMLTDQYSQEVQLELRNLSGGDPIRHEQYLDFLSGRTFRETLLIHPDKTPNRKVTGEAIKTMSLACQLKPPQNIDLTPGTGQDFNVPGSPISIELSGSLQKAALQILASAWPTSLPFDEILKTALLKADHHLSHGEKTIDSARKALSSLFAECFLNKAVMLLPAPPDVASLISDTPAASPYMLLQASRGKLVTNLFHKTLPLDEISLKVLQHLDSTIRAGDLNSRVPLDPGARAEEIIERLWRSGFIIA